MDWLVTIHSYWRYVVLILAIAAIVLAVLAYTGSRPWDALTDRVGMIFTIVFDIQVVLGILVWLLADYPHDDTFLRWIHPVMALIAVGLAHVGRVRSERAEGTKAKGAQAALFFVLSLVVVLLAIPLSGWHL